VATRERKMLEIQQNNWELYQYDAEFHVIAADLDWNHLALGDALRMGLSETMQDAI